MDTLTTQILQGKMPNLDYWLQQNGSLDEIDEYGYTPLIEAIIANRIEVIEALIAKKVNVNEPDVTGRTALHWAVNYENIHIVKLLLANGANPNAYTRGGFCVLVYPLLRQNNALKQLLYKYGAKPDFAQDYIYAKLIGHRFELQGDVDIVNAQNKFVELDYEGFILEFSLDLIQDSLQRFVSSYSVRHLKTHFTILYEIQDALAQASLLLNLQHPLMQSKERDIKLTNFLQSPLWFLPAASQGHVICFVRYKNFWVKIDRGENSKKEGSINVYTIGNTDTLDLNFINNFLYKRQPREFFHETISQQLKLVPLFKIPIPSQIVGNCSWANVQATILAMYFLLAKEKHALEHHDAMKSAFQIYEEWVEWDKDRALDECIHRFYLANPIRKASFASILGDILFQALDYHSFVDLHRAEKILPVLKIREYKYILDSFLEYYCVKKLTVKGNNLLKILDDLGYNPEIGVNPIATGLNIKDGKET